MKLTAARYDRDQSTGTLIVLLLFITVAIKKASKRAQVLLS